MNALDTQKNPLNETMRSMVKSNYCFDLLLQIGNVLFHLSVNVFWVNRVIICLLGNDINKGVYL